MLTSETTTTTTKKAKQREKAKTREPRTHMSRPQSPIWDDPSPIPRLRTVSDDLGLDVSDFGLVVPGRSEDAKVVDLRGMARWGGKVREEGRGER
jgi:hypothetical protein